MSSDAGGRRHRPRAPFDRRTLARLARRAGALALEAESPDARAARDRRLEVEAYLAEEAHAADPRPAVTLAREAGPLPDEEWTLTVDAIDGLDAYLAGLPTWSICLGLLHRGDPWSTVVCAPALDDLYVASSGELRWNGDEVPAGGPSGGSSRIVLGSGLEKRSILRLRRRREVAGPVSYHACLVARGAALGAVLGRLHVRQAAPLMALLAPTGAELVSLGTGVPVDLDHLRAGRPTRDPVVAAAAGRATELVARLKR